MGVQYIHYNNSEPALKNYFNHYFYNLKTNVNLSITGGRFLKTGTGKSYTGLKIGEIVDKGFGIDKVVYSPKEFLSAVDMIESITSQGTGRTRPAQCLMLDEGEITAPAQLWQSFNNKAISYTLATFRYLRCMSIMVSPAFSDFDKRARLLVNHWGYSEKFYKGGSQCGVRFYMYKLVTDQFGDHIWTNKIKMWNTDAKRVTTFSHFDVGMPSEELCKAYEEKARSFKKQLRTDVATAITRFEKFQSGDNANQKNMKDLAVGLLDVPQFVEQLQKNEKLQASDIGAHYIDIPLTNQQLSILSRAAKNLWNMKVK